MVVNSLKEMLISAKKGNYAVGAFNIFNYSSAKAAIMAAEELKSPIILQTSVGTVQAIGTIEIISMLKILRQEATVQVVIHLDHCKDILIAKQCIDAGWDSIMIDASDKPINENIRITSEVKRYAEKQNVCVEGELGIIKGVEEEISFDNEILANFEESIEYLNNTGIDAFAPAIGTAHGLYKKKVVLNFDLVKKLSEASECPVVIHGGTGLSEEDFHHLIKNGGTKVNISTAIKHAYFDAFNEYLKTDYGNPNPLKLDKYVEAYIKEVVKKHITIFNSVNRI